MALKIHSSKSSVKIMLVKLALLKLALRVIISFGLIAAVGFTLLFFVFVSALSETDRAQLKNADGIVVLTGTSPVRITEGFELLKEKYGKRLLITGVYSGQSYENIASLSSDRAATECCLDLDYIATTTVSNAVETRKWAEVHDFSSLIIVTSIQHMPRAMVEFRRFMPSLHITPYAVRPENIKLDSWWRYPGTFKLLIGEYARYVLSLIGLSA